jgi:transcriptional regulator with XRE-family HTH domain
MSAESFSSWVEHMRENHNWTLADCQRALGCGVNQVSRWMKTGAPKYIDLACKSITVSYDNTWSRSEGFNYGGHE